MGCWCWICPPEESEGYEALMSAAGLCVIYLVAPTTPDDRIEFIVKRGTGLSTTCRAKASRACKTRCRTRSARWTAKIRRHTTLPIAVGFGISNPDQARLVAASAEAIVVGSAVVNQIAAHGRNPDLVSTVAGFVKTLAQAINPAGKKRADGQREG